MSPATTPPAAHELLRRVQEAAAGTPYLVQETDTGFDVTVDVVDAQRYGLLNKAGLSQVYIHQVSFPRTGVFTIVDDARSVEWVAGVPQLKATAERQYGRVIELGAQKVWAFDEHGSFGVQADYTFSSEEGRDLITGVAEQLGLRQRRGTAEKVGLHVGLAAAAGSVVVLVVLLIAWLTGSFG